MSSIEDRKTALKLAGKNLSQFLKNTNSHLSELDKTDQKTSVELRLSIMNYIVNTKIYCEHPDFLKKDFIKGTFPHTF